MHFLVLGPLEVRGGDAPLPLGGAKQRAALAMLLLHANEVVSRDELIDGVWGEDPPPGARHALETHLSRVRGLLQQDRDEPRLTSRSPGYMLRVEKGELDLARFRALTVEADRLVARGDSAAAAAALREALAIFRGPPLQDLVHAPFAAAAVREIEEQRLRALETRIDADLATGRTGSLVGELETLVATHPLHEKFWAQLSRALYARDRQGDALDALRRARETLASELGVDPGAALQDAQKRILAQDPTLRVPPAFPAVGRPAERPARRQRSSRRARLVVGGLVMALAAALVLDAAGARHPTEPGPVTADAALSPGTTILDQATGRPLGFIAPETMAPAAYPLFVDGSFWVQSFEPPGFVQIDPRTGEIQRRLPVPARDPDQLADSLSLSPFAVTEDALWSAAADDVVRQDLRLGREVTRLRLDELVPGPPGVAEGVAVGGGSLWVSRSVGEGQIVRLDPDTGQVQRVFRDVTPYANLAFADGSLWVADQNGLARIDARTDVLTRTSVASGKVRPAGGSGFGFTTLDDEGMVQQVDPSGNAVASFRVGLGAQFPSYDDGRVWVSSSDDGTVTGVDVATGEQTTYPLGHPAGPAVAGDGSVLVWVDTGPTFEDRIDALPGEVATFFAPPGQLGGGDEAALNTDPGAFQIAFATCAQLLRYPDHGAPDGWQLRPEIAAALPKVSNGDRTYTFTVRPGFRFSPPFGEEITAETLRFSIERALSPDLAAHVPGALVLDDLRGEAAFRDGRAPHIAGLVADGNELRITLTHASGDFLHRLALPFFCPVPQGTPYAPNGLGGGGAFGDAGIPSAGPYYVSEYVNEELIILSANPNYHGPRPQSFDTIALREGVGAEFATRGVLDETSDGLARLPGPALATGGAIDAKWGLDGTSTEREGQRYYSLPSTETRFVAFNTTRSAFARPEARRAAARALDTAALAGLRGDPPSDRLLPNAVPGGGTATHSSTSPSMRPPGLTRVVAMLPVPAGCATCAHEAAVVRANLRRVGIDVHVRVMQRLPDPLANADIVLSRAVVLVPDGLRALTELAEQVPPGWFPPRLSTRLTRLEPVRGRPRARAVARLLQDLERSVPVAAYSHPQSSTLLGSRLGCRVFPPFGYGVDLAALCLEGASDRSPETTNSP